MLTDNAADSVPTYDTIYNLPDAIRLSFNPNSSRTNLFADDGIAFTGVSSIGEGTLTLETADLTPDHESRLLGNSYASGASVLKTSDQPAYVAIGGEMLLDTGAYAYVWFYKVKFSVPTSEDTTKGASVEFRTKSMEGSTLKLNSTANLGAVRIKTRTDDPAASSTFLANFFTAVPFASSDLNAVTVTAAAGTSGKIVFTFTKAGGGNITLNETTFTASNIYVSIDSTGALVTPSGWVFGTGGAAPTQTATASGFTAVKHDYVVTSGIKDASGVGCTAKAGSVTVV
jgi:phi13 family phage major tail protein